MNVDIAIIDIAAPTAYDASTIDNAPLGGTEAEVVYLAEALGKQGYTVAVLQLKQKYELSGKYNTYYLPITYLKVIKPKNVISVCSTAGYDLFPYAKKFSWQTSVWQEGKHENSITKIKEHNATVIAVSDWHKQNILSIAPDLTVQRIYNMVPDKLYLDAVKDYDKNRLCWLASPHKGLDKGLELFQQLRQQIPTLELHVFNPGYFVNRRVSGNGVVNHGAQARPYVWDILSKALCLYYPTEFEETFGCIAAEAEALRVPTASTGQAGLLESSSIPPALSIAELHNSIVEMHEFGRRAVIGQDRFKMSKVVEEWKLLFQ